jgi:hypothetical protein
MHNEYYLFSEQNDYKKSHVSNEIHGTSLLLRYTSMNISSGAIGAKDFMESINHSSF